MNRLRQFSFSRKEGRRQIPIDLVVCEGETEVDYLKALANHLRVRADVILGKGSDPESVVKTAEKKAKLDSFDQVYCVFDRDQHPTFVKGLALCQKLGFFPIISNPCFEVWPVLHFCEREAPFGSPQNVVKVLSNIPSFKKYAKQGVHVLEATRSFIGVGMKNAERLFSQQKGNFHKDPCTNVHQLVARFRALQKVQAVHL